MKILLLRAYYDPEQTAGTHLMNDLEEYLSDKCEIEYITPRPTRGISKEQKEEYKKKRIEVKNNGRIIIRRFRMFDETKNPLSRAFRYFCCNIVQLYQGCKSKNIDIVMSGSTPPTMGVICVWISKHLKKKNKKPVPYIYKLDDIFPDSLVSSGLSHRNGFIWRIGKKTEDYVYKNSDHIIVISEGMKNNLLEKKVPNTKISVINNWTDLDSVKPIDRVDNKLFDELKIPRDKYIVLYAGNFGEAQGAGIVLDVAQQLKNYKEIIFVIFGGGAQFAEIKESAKAYENIHVFDLQPQERVSEVYSMGNVSLITCKKGFGGIGFPSKTWNIMACNSKIIASYDMDSDLAELLKKSGAGVCVPSGDAKELSDAIVMSYQDEWKKKNAKKDIRAYVKHIASKESCTEAYWKVICNNYAHE